MQADASLVALTRSPAADVSGEGAAAVSLRIVPPDGDHTLCVC